MTSHRHFRKTERAPLNFATVVALALQTSGKLAARLVFVVGTFILFSSASSAADPLRVACVGDSITFGAGLKDRAHHAWPVRLGAWMGPDYDVRNFGSSGTTLLKNSDRPYVKSKAWPKALDFKPDILVIALGTNDSKHPGEGSLQSEKAVDNWQHKADFAADYEELIAEFRKVNPAVKVYACLPVPAFPGQYGINDKTIHDEIIPLIRQVAERRHATIIDLYTALSNKSALFPDTIHPNDDGAELIATAVYRALLQRDPPVSASALVSLLLNHRVLWLGDSITHNGQYVTFVEYYLTKRFPKDEVDFISIGLSSETVSGLSEKAHPFPRPCVRERLQRALDLAQPATVLASYGMNDGIYAPLSKERFSAFQDGIHALSVAVQQAKAQLILLTPTPFDVTPIQNKTRSIDAGEFSYLTPFQDYDNVLAAYSQWERGLPANEAREIIDLHTSVTAQILKRREKDPAYQFSKDGIHPNVATHLAMALEILARLGEPITVDDLDHELARVEKDPLYTLIRARREKRSAGWLDYVGYTREKHVKTDSILETEKTTAKAESEIKNALSR